MYISFTVKILLSIIFLIDFHCKMPKNIFFQYIYFANHIKINIIALFFYANQFSKVIPDIFAHKFAFLSKKNCRIFLRQFPTSHIIERRFLIHVVIKPVGIK